MKNKHFFCLISSICLFIILSSVVPTREIWSDLNNYSSDFYSQNSFMEIGLSNDWAYYNLMYLFKSLGLSFGWAKSCLMLLLVICMISFCKKFSYNVACFSLLFTYFNLCFQIGFLLRYAIAYYIFIFGLFCLIDNNVKYASIKYLFFVLVASQFHSGFYLFIVFVIANFNFQKIKKYRKILLLGMVFLVVLLVFLIRYTNIISQLANFVGSLLGSAKMSVYAGAALSRSGWLYIVGVWLITILNILYVDSLINKTGIQGNVTYSYYALQKMTISKKYISIDLKDFQKRCNLILYICSFFAPICIFSLHLHRYLQYMSFFNIVYLAVLFDVSKNKKRVKRYIVFSAFVITFIWLYFAMFIYKTFSLENITDYMINGNWFGQY